MTAERKAHPTSGAALPSTEATPAKVDDRPDTDPNPDMSTHLIAATEGGGASAEDAASQPPPPNVEVVDFTEALGELGSDADPDVVGTNVPAPASISELPSMDDADVVAPERPVATLIRPTAAAPVRTPVTTLVLPPMDLEEEAPPRAPVATPMTQHSTTDPQRTPSRAPVTTLVLPPMDLEEEPVRTATAATAPRAIQQVTPSAGQAADRLRTQRAPDRLRPQQAPDRLRSK